MSSAEIAGWLDYLRMDDEVRAAWTTHAIVKAFQGNQQPTRKQTVVREEDDEIIDTTDPDFAKNFKGFINEKPKQPVLRQPRSTEIKMG